MVKKIFSFLVCILIFTSITYSQIPTLEVNPRKLKVNRFLHNAKKMKILRNYTHRIYPSGIMELNIAKAHLYDIDGLLELIGVQEGTTFKVTKTRESKNIEGGKFERYQQYYKGVKVDGGGYARFVIDSNPHPPCEEVNIAFSPNVYSLIDITTTPEVSEDELPKILMNYGIDENSFTISQKMTPELLITEKLEPIDKYNLVWKVHYLNKVPKVAWIDAITGKVLRNDDTKPIYAGPSSNLNTSNQHHSYNNIYPLESFNLDGEGELIIHDLTLIGTCITTIEDLADDPFVCPDTSTNTIVLETFDILNTTINLYQTMLGIEFTDVHVGLSPSCSNAVVFNGSTTTSSGMIFGTNEDGVSLSTSCEIVAHELAHVILLEYIDYSNIGQQTLHEGLADFFGLFIGQSCQAQQGIAQDWIMGNELGATISRNLENPIHFDCYTDIDQCTCDEPNIEAHPECFPHIRGELIGHFCFRLLNTMSSQEVFGLVFDALELYQGGGIPGFIDAIKTVTTMQYGLDSDHAIAVWNIANAICIGHDHDAFNYTIHIPPGEKCESSPNFTLSLNSSSPDIGVYRWRINGPQSTDWEINNQTTSGNTHYGDFLNVTDIPKYDYYPQYFEVCVYAPLLGPDYKQCVSIKIEDCEGDDPTCQDFHDSHLSDTPNYRLTSNDNLKENVKVYDLLGVLLYEGAINNFKDYKSNTLNQIVVVAFFDKDGNWVNSKKVFLQNLR